MNRNPFVMNFVFTIYIFAVNPWFINALSITNNFDTVRDIQTNFSSFSLIFKELSSLCIASEHEEVLYGLLEIFSNDWKPIYIRKVSLFVGEVILEGMVNYGPDCGGALDSYETTVVYLLEGSISPLYFGSLEEAGLSVAQSQEVLAVSLSDSSVFQLSPVFPQPRHFVKTSVTEVLQRRVEKTKKLDVQGSVLNVGTLRYIPYFFFYSNETNSSNIVPGEYYGLYEQLVTEMAHQFNFSCNYIIYHYFGTALDNGTWIEDGLGYVIQKGLIDIVAISTWQVPQFYNIMDFGPGLNKVQMAFLVLRPEVIDFQWEAILRIFKPIVWSAIAGSFVLTVVMYWAGMKWGLRPHAESWTGCIITMFGYFTISSSYSRVNKGNIRFTLTSWSYFSLLITTTLSTGIVTRLTIPSYSARIDTVKQLVESNFFWSLQFYADFMNNTLLKQSLFDLENYWIQLFEKRYVYMDGDEVWETAGTNKKMAFVVQLDGNEFVVLETAGLDEHKNLKNYRVSKEALTEAHVSFGVRKKSLLLKPLTDIAMLFVQVGLMTHWKKEVNRKWPQYDYRHLLIERDFAAFREPQGLPLYKVLPVFLLLLFGLGLASFVCFVEICWYLALVRLTARLEKAT